MVFSLSVIIAELWEENYPHLMQKTNYSLEAELCYEWK